jgi:uridine kinase
LESGILEPFARGDPARYRPYDWARRRRGRTRTVRPADVVLLDGVSCGRRSIAERVAYVIWMETPRATRLTRGLERDGEAMRMQWDGWMAAEDLFDLNDPVRDRANLIGRRRCLHPG